MTVQWFRSYLNAYGAAPTRQRDPRGVGEAHHPKNIPSHQCSTIDASARLRHIPPPGRGPVQAGWQRSSVVEQGNHNPLVGGSNPSAATISHRFQ